MEIAAMESEKFEYPKKALRYESSLKSRDATCSGTVGKGLYPREA